MSAYIRSYQRKTSRRNQSAKASAYSGPILCVFGQRVEQLALVHTFIAGCEFSGTSVGQCIDYGSWLFHCPEGSAAISYTVFTLLLTIPAPVARNFSFAIQSIGMTSASLLILGLRVRVDWNYIRYVTLGGVFGLVFGTYYVVPLISPVAAKLFFVSHWLSFGITLWRENRNPSRIVLGAISNFQPSNMIRLALFGLVGGLVSSIFGTGLNIFTFCLVTIYYGLSEKIATPSSVIIMPIETLLRSKDHTY